MVTCSASTSPVESQPLKQPPAMEDEAQLAPHIRLRVSWKGRFVQVRGRWGAGLARLQARGGGSAPPPLAPTARPLLPALPLCAAGRSRRLALPGRRPLPGERARVYQVRRRRRRAPGRLAAPAAGAQPAPCAAPCCLELASPAAQPPSPAPPRHAPRRYADLMFSLAEKVDGAVSVKYQLPGEELDPDSLISVNDDGDIKARGRWRAGGAPRCTCCCR